MPEPSSAYESLVGDYTKFMLLRIAVFAVIVISIYSGTSQLRNLPSEKIDTVRAIRNITYSGVEEEDDLVELMFFYDKEESLKQNPASGSDTLLVNDMIAAKFPGSSIEDIHNDTTGNIRNYLADILNKVYSQIKEVSDRAFIIKLSVLTDLSFDLRYWVFILPILFAAAAIYSYILKFRIALQQLEDDKNNDGTKNHTPRQFPYLYLKGLFDLVNLSLLLFFLVSIYDISIHFKELLLFYLATFYILTFYFSLVYIGTVHRKIFNGHLPENSLLINRLWDWSIKKLRQFVRFIQYKHAFRAGALFLILTLFLSMTFETCTTGDDKPKTIKGYKLIIDYKNSIWQYDDPPLAFCRFYQLSYISLFLVSIFFGCLLLRKKRVEIPAAGLKALVLYFSSLLVIFSTYFSFYLMFYPADWICYQSAFILILWIRANYATSFKRAKWDYPKLAETLIIYCLPLLLFSSFWLSVKIDIVPGWMFLCAGIIFLTISCYFFAYCQVMRNERNTNVT